MLDSERRGGGSAEEVGVPETEKMDPTNIAVATFRICTWLITSMSVLADLGGMYVMICNMTEIYLTT